MKSKLVFKNIFNSIKVKVRGGKSKIKSTKNIDL